MLPPTTFKLLCHQTFQLFLFCVFVKIGYICTLFYILIQSTMKKYLLSVLCLLAALYAFSQTNVVPFSPSDAIGEGVVYCLPKTVIVVETETEQTVQKVGPFVKYAQLYLGVKDVVVEDKSVWQLTAVKLRSMAQ